MLRGIAPRDGVLCVDGVPLTEIAEAVGTPTYVYSRAGMTEAYCAYRTALDAIADTIAVDICFAVKANGNLAVLKTLGDLGAGMDVVSGGELARALAAGVSADRIVFSGVGKTAAELTDAMEAGVHQINVESLAELEVLSALAAARGITMPVAIRINPDVDARTHAKITTGKAENKFGIDLAHAVAAFRRAKDLPGVQPLGVALHIGSQLTDLEPYRVAYRKVADLVRTVRQEGIAIDRLDLGGGLGIPYTPHDPRPDLAGYAELVRNTVGDLGCRAMIEPGRSLVGEAGVLLARVIYAKAGATRRFLVLDAAMNDLIRPTLYEAHHEILPVVEPAPGTALLAQDVVGPVCETGDTFGRDRMLPALEAGALVAICGAGAYGAVMTSGYNARPLTPEVMASAGRFAVVRKRPTLQETLAQEAIPPWLAA